MVSHISENLTSNTSLFSHDIILSVDLIDNKVKKFSNKMELTVKPCFVRLVRLTTNNSSHAKVDLKSQSTATPKKIPTKKKIRCPVCNKIFKWNSEMEKHVRRHTGERPFACSICKQRFKSQGEVNKHSSTVHTDSRPFSCLWCDKSFKKRAGLMQHLGMHTKEKPYFCKECPLSFAKLGTLSQHALTKHNSGKGKKCEYCSKVFYGTYHLERHRRIHTGEKPFSCVVCGKSYARRVSLVSHSAVHSNGGQSRPFKCTKCPKSFRCRNNLYKHTLNVHEKVRRHSCGICGKKFFTKGSRDVHMNSHTNEKPYKCPKCPKRFGHQAALSYHLKGFHGNRRDFKCSKCPLAFVDKDHLNIHFQRIHANPSERPFACLFCCKRYCLPNEFENHLRSHLAEKPHFCNLCSFSSGTSGDLGKHVRGVHTSRSN